MWMVAAQFFMFMELPYDFSLPKVLLAIMVIMSIISTYFAVAWPIQAVNDRPIASVIKGL